MNQLDVDEEGVRSRSESQNSDGHDTTTDAKGFPANLLSGRGKKSDSNRKKHENLHDNADIYSGRVPIYKMDYPSNSERGHVVIINNENFHWTTGMNQRRGTDADEKNLVRLFNKLDFHVESYKDKSKSEIMQIVRDMSNEDHTSFECFIMVFLSHGDDGVIYGTDGTLEIKSIVDFFSGKACPTLAGKPKVFIFQACRGDKHEVPVEPAGDVVDGIAELNVSDDVVDAGVKPTIPSASDILFCYSVTEGFYSHRDTFYGSWYIQAFVEVFEEELVNRGHKSAMQHDVLDLLTLVNHKVSRKSVERTRNPEAIGKKQMPCFLSMLTKKLYLAPKQ